MILFITILCIVAVILFLPASLVVEFDVGFNFYIKVLFFKIRLSKRDKKPKKQKTEKKTKKKKKTDSESFLSKLHTLNDILKIICKNMHYLLVVKHIDADITVATGDPCSTALAYGGVNTLIYSAVSLLECGFKVKKKNIKITADYNAEKTSVYFETVLTTFVLRLIIFLILSISDGIIKLINKKEN